MDRFIVQRLNYTQRPFLFLRLGQSFVWLGVSDLFPYHRLIKTQSRIVFPTFITQYE